ncbi:hypothetical protein DQ226_13865 [Dietzia maris]|uniref:Uncharacterized protein n=2 Tax=Dietzia TaxID=37914 RepID=A0A365P7R8_9ACTN|nr:hypothetical protein H483_0117485 [Dietzia sp. UCD-THP]RBA32470.1 hypothetical protein DQ226_13865 [Dietzia maris]
MTLLVTVAVWLPLVVAFLAFVMLTRLLTKQTIMHRGELYWQSVTRTIAVVVAVAGAAGIAGLAYVVWRVQQVWELRPSMSGNWTAYATDYASYTGLSALIAVLSVLGFAPGLWLIGRAAFLWKVRYRRSSVPDVVTLEQTEIAIQRRAAVDTAAKHGIDLNSKTNIIGPLAGRETTTAPLVVPTKTGTTHAFAVVVDKMLTATRQQNTDWQVADTMVAPSKPGAGRALLLAESGAGKTELLTSLMLCHRANGHGVLFIDGKGDRRDASNLAERYGATVHYGGYDFFAGTVSDVIERLMKLIPVTESTTYYADEARDVITRVLAHWEQTDGCADVAEFGALWEIAVADELDRIAEDETTRPYLTGKVQGGQRHERAWLSLQKGLGQVEQFHQADGWTVPELLATEGFHVVPIVDGDESEVLLANLMIHDMRRYLAQKKREQGTIPGVLVIDEFAQIVRENLSEMPAPKMAATMFETTRSLNMGLYLSAQSLAGIAEDENMQRRILQAGAALIVGRGKDSEVEANAFGTVFHGESTGDASGFEAKSTRAQHTYRVSPNAIRELPNGVFFFGQGGSVRQMIVLPARR